MKHILMLFLVGALLLGSVAFATLISPISVPPISTDDSLAGRLANIQSQIQSIVPIISLVMIVLAGLVYAAGQVMGAEMRSRASVWATSLLVGAIIGLVLAASAGGIVGMFSGAALISGP